MKRQRGRGRKPGGGHHQPNRNLESNGPDVKVRGTAAHIYERYLQLARDASSSGDRIMAENYLQHAEHYFRVWRATQPSLPPQQITDRFGAPDLDDEDEAGAEGENAEAEGAAEAGEQPDVDYPAQQQGQDGGRQQDGDFRRRRGRRNRFRPGGGGEGDGEGGQERRAERGEDEGERPERQSAERQSSERQGEDREPRRERQPRQRNEEGAAEGFSNGPRPAFLGSD